MSTAAKVWVLIWSIAGIILSVATIQLFAANRLLKHGPVLIPVLGQNHGLVIEFDSYFID